MERNKNLPQNLAQNIGVGVASLTFGVALSIFIYSVASGKVVSVPDWLLFFASFLLMMRFWWRYVELFVLSIPSQTFWQFFFDFLIPFFAILAVLFVANFKLWTVLIGAGMLASMARCGLSWHGAEGVVLEKLKRTFYGALGMFGLMALAGLAAFLKVSTLVLAAMVLVPVAFFVFYAAQKP